MTLCNPAADGLWLYWIGKANHFMNQRVCILVECATIKSSGFYAGQTYEDKMVHAEIIANGKVVT
jgi:hypothetical protein